MKNDYNETLDRNGYSESHLPSNGCFFCGYQGALVRHEVYHGSSRTNSKKYGAWVTLCPRCHNELHFIDPSKDEYLKSYAKPIICDWYGWGDLEWLKHFRKLY